MVYHIVRYKCCYGWLTFAFGKNVFLSYVVDFNLDLIEKHVEDMVWPWWCVGQYDLVILSCLVSIVCSNCIVQDSLYYDMVIGSKWNCVLGSCTPSQSIRLFFGDVGCSFVECHYVFLFTNSFIKCCFVMMVITNIEILVTILLISNYTFRLSLTR